METIEHWLFDPAVGKLAAVLIGVVIVIAGVKAMQRLVNQYVRDTDTRYRGRKAATFFGYVVVILYLVVLFQDRLGGLTVALGVAGAGIAFALQEVIASAAGWLAIIFARFFSVGDRVQISGVRGDVIDIGILRTTLMDCGEWVGGDQYNGRIVRIANSAVFKDPVFNYSADFPFLWDEIRIPVTYSSDRNLSREIFGKALDEVVGSYVPSAAAKWGRMVDRYRIEDARIEPAIFMSANDNWIEFALRYVVDARQRRSTRDRLFTYVLDAIDGTNGRVKVASSTVALVSAPPLDVRWQRSDPES